MNPRSTEAYNSLSDGNTSNNELVETSKKWRVYSWDVVISYSVQNQKTEGKIQNRNRENTDLLEEQVS